MTKEEANTYAWIDAESVKHKQNNPRDDSRVEKQMISKALDFIDML